MSIETEITRITNEVSTQTDLIGQIATALTNVVIPPAGSGGGSVSPAIMCSSVGRVGRGYYSSSTSKSYSVITNISRNAIVHDCIISYGNTQNSSATTASDKTSLTSIRANPTLTEYETYVSVSYSRSFSLRYYWAYTMFMQVMFSFPGLYIKTNTDGTMEMYADENLTEMSNTGSSTMYPVKRISRADLSNSNLTYIPSYMFESVQTECEILLPATISNVETYSLKSSYITSIDFSKCTSVPSLYDSYSCIYAGTTIFVPSALYDEWIAATNWSAYADYIVAV